MPPASAAQGIIPNPHRGMSFLLGCDYERKKQILQQELQLDYKQYISKKNDLKTREPNLQPQGLSLPIDEKRSVKEKLREERNKEYNLFLQEQAQIRKLKRGTPPVTSKPRQVQASDAVNISSEASPLPILNTYTNAPPSHQEHPASRRDAATLTEPAENGKTTGTWRPGPRQRRRWKLYRPKELYTSEEELNTDKEEAYDFRYRRRQERHIQEPEYKEERRARERRMNRNSSQDIKEVEAVIHDPNNNDRNLKSDLQMPDSMRTAARSTPGVTKDKTEFATGLMIGSTEEQTVTQMRKEQYKQELLSQIAEQRRNKMEEKRLELRVAATGATDPEKEPDRIKQFGAVNRQHGSLREDVPHKPGADLEAIGKDPNPRPKRKDNPPGKSQVDHSAAPSQLPGKTVPRSGMGVPSLDYFSEDYHRDFSDMLGDVAVLRVADVAPPVPPIVPKTYKTQNDAAYFYYGTRNPLDPSLSNNQNDFPEGVQQSGDFDSRAHIKTTHQHRASPFAAEELHADKSKQRRESVLSYQEALRQQIKEREELKRREREKERYDAKTEAELTAYNPWGRGGGGAPIKDQNGNLVSDLNQMHKINEQSYRNPVGAEARTPSGLSDQPPPLPPHTQNSYKEALKLQIEENKRRQTEERERIRMEEEEDERRLAKERARIQQEYEDEQRKQKIEQRLQQQSFVHEPRPRHHKQEKKMTERKGFETVPQSVREEKNPQLNHEVQREPSPPIPTLRKKQTDPVASRPSSVVSQLSCRTERSVSAPQHRPVPARPPQLQDGQQEVIRELSALRRYLRREQRQLEIQLGQTGPQETRYTPPIRRRPRADAFERQKEAVQSSARSPSTADAGVNKQNIREFNQLKYRDTASREEVRAMYPDPPTDAHSLDIQQQALLRQQQRKIRLMNRQGDPDYLGHPIEHHHPRRKPESFIHRESLLPSETAFIERVPQQRSSRLSAGHRERTASGRRHNCDKVDESVDQRERDNLSATGLNLKSEVSTHNQHENHIMRQTHTGDHNSITEGLSGDEVDVSSLRSALGRHASVETVATEPWLRPGTSDAVKHSVCRERPNSRMDAPPWLTHRVM